METIEDEDGIDGPFERGMDQAMRDDVARSRNGDASRAECEARQFLQRVWERLAPDVDQPDPELRADLLLDQAFDDMEEGLDDGYGGISHEAQCILLEDEHAMPMAMKVVA